MVMTGAHHFRQRCEAVLLSFVEALKEWRGGSRETLERVAARDQRIRSALYPARRRVRRSAVRLAPLALTDAGVSDLALIGAEKNFVPRGESGSAMP